MKPFKTTLDGTTQSREYKKKMKESSFTWSLANKHKNITKLLQFDCVILLYCTNEKGCSFINQVIEKEISATSLIKQSKTPTTFTRNLLLIVLKAWAVREEISYSNREKETWVFVKNQCHSERASPMTG